MKSNKMSIRNKATAFMMGLCCVFYTGAAVLADDTEIYDGSGTSFSAPPLVMFTIDYAPPVLNSSVSCTSATCTQMVADGYLDSTTTTRFGLLQAVLKKIIDPLSDMKIGLMMSHNAENNCAGPSDSGCSGGGYILSGFKSISSGSWETDTNKAEFFSLLDELKTLADGADGNDTHTFQGREVFFEFFRYITGHDAYSSHLGWTDYGTDNTYNLSSENDKYKLMRDLDIEGINFIANASSDGDKAQNIAAYNSPGTYTSPVTEDCQKIFTVNFLKGVTNSDADADDAIMTSDATTNANNRSGYMSNIDISGKNKSLETVLEYLHGVDFGDGSWGKDTSHGPNSDDSGAALLGKQNVTSYFIVDHSGLNTGNDWAAAGGSTAAIEWTDDPDDLIDQMTSIFSQILSTSTTFTAASVPVSVLNRAQIVDNVFIALFKSDPDGKERWPGNLKRLKLDTDDGLLKDQNDINAVSGVDGRILHSALTFWTDAATLPAADTSNDEIDGKDGRAVARGGAGQQIPGFVSGTIGMQNDLSDSTRRKVLYEPSSGTTLSNLNVDDTTASDLQSALGAASASEAKILLKYIRGLDVTDTSNESTPRDWILGDPLHSRPLPINYGNRDSGAYSDTVPDIRLVFGTNDGLFHMVENSTTAAHGSAASGKESWAFMPRSVMGIVDKLKTNDATNDHPYGVDGAPSVYTLDNNNDGVLESSNSDKVWVYFGLRRGGRAYYALDISDPDAPTYKWSITNASTGFSELGYTFSQPRVGKMNWGSGEKPVIVFTGGYDMDKDYNPDTFKSGYGNDDMGRAFYVVDADTGALVWKVEQGTTGYVSNTEYNHALMVDSIPSTPSVVDTDGDGLFDRAYVGDTGGKVWRFDMSGSNRANWKATVLASVGRRNYVAGGGSDSDNDAYLNDRRFFHRPDFIQFKDSTGDYDAVVIASGNRANPKKDMDGVNSVDAVNYAYMIKDRYTSSGTTSASTFTHSSFDDITDNCLQDNSCSTTPTLANGWKLEFEEEGEKALATPTTLAKKIFVTTYLPEGGAASGDCSPKEGSGRLYALNLADGTAVNDYDVSNGDDLEKTDRYVDLESGGIPAEVVYVPFNRILKPDLSIEDVGISGRWKTYWFKEEN